MNKIPKVTAAALIVIVLILIASYLMAMLLGPALFFLTPAGLSFSLREVQPPILLFLLGFYLPFTLSAGQLFLLIWGVFVLCFIVAWRLRESFHIVVSKAFSRPLNKLFNNWLFAMPLIASALYAAVFLIIDVQGLFRVPTGAIPSPQTNMEYFDLFLSLSYASIIEEVGFRITPIGTFLLAQLLLIQSERSTSRVPLRQRLELFLASFLYPDRAKRMVDVKNVASNGVRDGIRGSEWLILIITSLVFGVAHLVSGIGWEVGKITSASLQGFVFGLVYLAYGVQAPILLHWFFNYYFYAYELGARYSISTLAVSVWVDTFTLTLGRLCLIMLTTVALRKILTRKEQKAKLNSRAFSP